MKKLFVLSTLLVVSMFAISGVAFGWGAPGGDGSNYKQNQEIAIFYNNTASASYSNYSIYHGQAVILDTNGTGVTSGTTLGAYVEKPANGSGNADSILVVGVAAGVGGPFVVSGPIPVITKGPALVETHDSSDAISINTAVGCSGTGEGGVGDGTNLGIALEAGDGTDGDEIIIWVSPTGAD